MRRPEGPYWYSPGQGGGAAREPPRRRAQATGGTVSSELSRHRTGLRQRGHTDASPPSSASGFTEQPVAILLCTGVRLERPRAVELLRGADCTVDADGIVHIPATLIDWALERAPRSFTIYDRDGEPAMVLDGRAPTTAPVPTVSTFSTTAAASAVRLPRRRRRGRRPGRRPRRHRLRHVHVPAR